MAEPNDNNPPADATPANAGGGADDLAQAALKAAQDAIASLQGDVNQAAGESAESGAPYELPVFAGGGDGAPAKGIDLLSDVNLNVKIELGRTRMLVEDVLQLAEGAIVELEKLAGDPVDIFVNDRPIARGEVLVLNDNFCVRINEILQPGADERAVG